jgi:hypothetical protein
MTEERKVQIPVTVDGSGAKAGFDDIKQGARDMAQAVSVAGQQASTGVDKLGQAAGQAAQKTAEGADKATVATGRWTAAITRALNEERALAAGAKGSAAYFEERARAAGANADAIKPLLVQLDALRAKNAQAAESFRPLGVSAAQTAAAMRQVPAQFTDIVTSLQAGQAPMTVLLQQGGQLKDAFGGVGAAARALGGFVLGMVNPLTIAAAVIGGVAFAAHKGSEELRAFQNAATLAGNSLGFSASQFAAVRDSLGGIATQGKAAEVLTEIARSGKIAGEQVREIAEAAILMEKATGQAIGKTVEQFAQLATEPSKAVLKLNEGTNFLTASIYAQIKALEDQGRKADAARVATEAFANSTRDRASAVIENVGLMERAWRGLVDTIKRAGDAVLSVGRQQSTGQQLAGIQAQIAKANRPFDVSAFGGNAEERARLPALREEERRLIRMLELEQQNATAAAERNRVQAAGVVAVDAVTKALEKGMSKQEEFQKRIGEFRKSMADLAVADPASKLLSDAKAIKAAEDAIRREVFGDGKAKASKPLIDPAAVAVAKQYTDTLADLLRIQQGASAQAESLSKSQARLRQEMESPAWASYGRQQREQIIASAAAAQQAEDEADARKRLAEIVKDAAKSYRAMIDAQSKAADAVGDQVQKLRDEAEAAAIAGGANISLAEAVELVTIRRLEEKQIAALGNEELVLQIQREIDKRKELLGLLGGKATREAAEATAKEFQRTADNINQSLTDALLRGFESGKSFAENFRDTLKNMFQTLVLRPIISGVLAPVSGALAGVGQSIVGGGGSALSGGGNLANIGSSVLGGTSIANTLGTTFANATATGLDGFLATNAAFGTAAGGSTALSALMGAAPYLAIGAIALKLISDATKGETRAGGQYNFNQGAGTQLGFTPSGGNQNDAEARQLIDSTVATLNRNFAALNVGAQVANLSAAFETSGKGRGGVRFGGNIAADGSLRAFGETGTGSQYDGSFFEKTSSQSPKDAKAALDAFIADSYQAQIQAYQALADKVPEAVRKIVDGVDAEALSLDAAKGITDKIQTVITDIERFRAAALTLPFEALRSKSADAALAMAEAAGGMDALLSGLGSFTESFTTREEKRLLLAEQIAQRVNAAGGATSAEQVLALNAQQFRDFVDSMKGNDGLYGALLAVSPAVAQLTGSLDDMQTAAQQAAAASADAARAAQEQAAANVAARDKERTDLYNTFVDLYSTPEEKRRATAAQILGTVNAAGGNLTIDDVLGATREQFRAEVERLMGAGAAGEPVLAALLSVAQAFASIAFEAPAAGAAAAAIVPESGRPAYDSVFQPVEVAAQAAARAQNAYTDSLKQFREELQRGELAMLSPKDQYEAARAEFMRLAALSPGDEERLAGLESAGRAFLEASRGAVGSRFEYSMDRARVLGAVQASEIFSGGGRPSEIIGGNRIPARTDAAASGGMTADQADRLIAINESQAVRLLTLERVFKSWDGNGQPGVRPEGVVA